MGTRQEDHSVLMSLTQLWLEGVRAWGGGGGGGGAPSAAWSLAARCCSTGSGSGCFSVLAATPETGITAQHCIACGRIDMIHPVFVCRGLYKTSSLHRTSNYYNCFPI